MKNEEFSRTVPTDRMTILHIQFLMLNYTLILN